MSAVADQPVNRYGAPDRFERPERKLSLEQQEIVDEFKSIYGLDDSQISFDKDGTEPIFDFDALCLIANELGDFPTITTIPIPETQSGRATAQCTITDGRGVTRSQFGSCFIGSALPNGNIVDDDQTNLDVAQARALRRALRSIGFNVVRSHKARLAGIVVQPTLVESQRVRDTKALHKMAEDIGHINGRDKTTYQSILAVHFNGKISSSDLTDQELCQAVAFYGGLVKARDVIKQRNNQRPTE